jgi:glutathione reductase (NADPH)
MADYDYDLFVIGAGSGGVRASRVSSAYGARVAVAEEYRVGGTCVIRGCVPKKLLVYGAHFAEDLKDAKRFGWQVPLDCAFDWATLRDNVLADVDRLNGLYTQGWRMPAPRSSSNAPRSPVRTKSRWRAARRSRQSTS